MLAADATPTAAAVQPPPADPPPDPHAAAARSGPVRPFAEMNERLWGIPHIPPRRPASTDDTGDAEEAARQAFVRDWDCALEAMQPAPDETCGPVQRYLYNWLGPFLTLAHREELAETAFPPPRRAHQARMCGSRLCAAFREEAVLHGRDSWRRFLEPAYPISDGDGDGAGAAAVGELNPLSVVAFRGEPQVRGRLRWVGYVRASNTPHQLYAGVEWDAASPLPSARVALLAQAGAPTGAAEAVVHDGSVHGERLFYQCAAVPARRCTCERLADIELLPPALATEQGPREPAGGAGGGGVVAAEARRLPQAPSLMRVLLRTFRKDLLAFFPPAMWFTACQLSNPILLQWFVTFLGSNRATHGLRSGVLALVVIAAIKITGPLADQKEMQRSNRAATMCEMATLAAVFEKCLTISPAALADPEMSAGRILTMASSDAENIKGFIVNIFYLFMAPAMLLFYLAYLWYLVGSNALAGLVVLVITTPLQLLFAHMQETIQVRLSKCTDRRLQRTNELLNGIRIVKTMGWEERFLQSIEADARREEQRERALLQIMDTVSMVATDGSTMLIICAILFSFVVTGHTLTAEVVFPVITIIGSIGFPIMMIPMTIISFVKFRVSTNRIGRFLECDDQCVSVRDIRELFASTPADAIVFSRATIVAWAMTKLRAHPASAASGMGLTALLQRLGACWRAAPPAPVELEWEAEPANADGGGAEELSPQTPQASAAGGEALEGNPGKEASSQEETDGALPAHTVVPKPLLRDVDLRIPAGKLTVVVGATGSGKSSMLGAVLGALGVRERHDRRGSVWASRDLAYVPQQPHILQDSIRANVTFFEDAASAGQADARRTSAGVAARGSLLCSPLWRGRGLRLPPREPLTRLERAQEARLAAALRCCQLDADLRELADGVDTEIGEKGVNLSGGQKARVGLARAVYADRAVYLLDDPLSAVDVHVGGRLIHEVLLGALAGKTRVLVTHQVHVLPSADFIVVMRAGRVVFSGSYAAYAASEWQTELQRELPPEQAESEEGVQDDFSPPASPTAREAASAEERACGGQRRLLEVTAGKGQEEESPALVATDMPRQAAPLPSDSGEDDGDAAQASKTDPSQPAQKIMTEEEKETGRVPWSIYGRFVKLGGGSVFAAVVVLLDVLNIACYLASHVWLSAWATAVGGLTQWQYLSGYLALVMVSLSLHPMRTQSIFIFIRRAGGRLHELLLYTVACGKIAFFDSTPLGRLVNRFSKDMYVLDNELSQGVILFFDVATFISGALILTVVSAPLAIVVVVPAAGVFYHLLAYYSTVIREVRRRGSVAQSPLFSLLEEVTAGRQSIDAYGKARTVFAESLARLDKLYAARYVEKCVTLWLSVRVELLSASVVIAISITGLLEKAYYAGDVLPARRVGLVSLALSMSFELFWTLSATIQLAASVEASMSSTQRVLHYVDTVPREELLLHPPHGSSDSSSSHSPSSVSATEVVVVEPVAVAAVAAPADARGADARGSMELRHVDLRYREGLPLVLRDVSFTIRAREKIGVVGRTGSGKSTLLQAFLRLVDVSAGELLVNGRRAAAEYTLPALRRLFALIPQDPVLFEGTVRSNLDPFNESTDAAVRRTVALVGLREVEPDAVVREGGSNFSVGQRQLLCMARALLKKGSAFILMDEATANVDPVLDRQIQQVVREHFDAYTVITIAHRLHTVAGCDRVFIMERGQLVEQGPPRDLAMNESTRFHRMVTQGASRRRGATRQQRQEAKDSALRGFLDQCGGA